MHGVLTYAVSIVAITSIAADWPVFRGNPAQTGVVAETLPEQLAVKWTFKTGNAIEGAAAIVGGVVYIGSLDGFTYAIDLATGKEKWKFASGSVKAPLGVDAGKVFAGNDDGIFHCIEAATGKPLWKFDAASEVTSGSAFVGDSVLFGCGDEQLHCLNRVDGKARWKFQVTGGPVQGTPVIAGDKTFAAGCDSQLHKLELSKGKELSTLDLGGQVGASAALAHGKLFVATMTNEVLAVDVVKMDIAWRFESRKRQAFYASPAVTDKLVIAACRDKRVYALDRKTGTEVWSFATEGRIDSSPVVAGKRIYVGSFDKILYALDLETGKEVQKLPLDSSILASPAVADGCLILGSEKGTVYCFGKP